MAALLKNRLAYLTTSFVLFLLAYPLISIGTTGGPRVLLWIGLGALVLGALIPPLQRLVCGPSPSGGSKSDAETADQQKAEGVQ